MRIRRVVCLTFMLGVIVAGMIGCGSRSIQEVNRAAIASRVSFTDEESRSLVEKSFALLPTTEENYRVGPDDLLEISIFEWEVRQETRTIETRVAQNGGIFLPLLGEVNVSGKTSEEIQAFVTQQLREKGILLVPRVSVVIKEYSSKRVAVIGAVENPGIYTLRKNSTTLFEALTQAGGVNERAGQVLHVIRTAQRDDNTVEKRAITVDLYELLELGVNLDMVLQNGDVINVPEAKQFFVVGFVNEPGGFALNKPTTVLEAVALAGGLREKEASPSKCMLKRNNIDQIPLDLVAISRGKAPNYYLRPNDVIDVRQTVAKRVRLEVFDTFKALFSVGYALN